MSAAVDDCFSLNRGHIGLRDALDLLAERLKPVVGCEPTALIDAAGRILAQDLVSQHDVPAFDNVAVDGFAFAAASLSSEGSSKLTLVEGRAAAGHPFSGPVPAGACLRVLTGAVLPDNTDTIVMQEEAAVEDGAVILPAGIKANANRRRRGEDIRAGQCVIRSGCRLAAHHIGVAAELGLAAVPVFQRLRVALFSSGDEIVEPGTVLNKGQVYDANRYILLNLLRDLPIDVTDLGILSDDASSVRKALIDASRHHDVILASGGASRGDEDHVVRTVEANGSLHFWQIAMKPGRPLAFGHLGTALFVGLPGNPVAATVCFLRIARPVLLRLAGTDWREPIAHRVPAGFAMRKRAGRCEFLRARLRKDAQGELSVERITREGSGILTSLSEADGLVELDPETTSVEQGSMVNFLSFAELTA